MTTYQWNETVDIAIRGARVDHHADGELWIQVPGAKAGSLVPLTDAVSVTTVQPADGPAQPGDIWRDKTGRRWFAYDVDTTYDGRQVKLTNGHMQPRYMKELCADYAPLTLEYRAPVVEQPDPLTIDEPAERVVAPLAAASQQLRESTDGASFMAGVGALMDASRTAAQHEQGDHDDCDPARCADAERAVAELHGEVSA